MNVEQIKFLIFYHAHHFARQREFIRWIFKQRVGAELYFMVI